MSVASRRKIVEVCELDSLQNSWVHLQAASALDEFLKEGGERPGGDRQQCPTRG